MTTNKEDIRRLLDLYMEGKTSLEEEALLMEYFRSPDADKDFADFKTMFNQFDEGEPSFTEEEQERWMQSCPPEAAPDSSDLQAILPAHPKHIHCTRQTFIRWIAVASIAAACFFLGTTVSRKEATQPTNSISMPPTVLTEVKWKTDTVFIEKPVPTTLTAKIITIRDTIILPASPQKDKCGQPSLRGGHIYHQNGLNTPTRHRPTRRRHGNPTTGLCHTWPTFRPSSKSRKEEWTNSPNNMNISTLIMKTYIKYWLMAVITVIACTNHVHAQEFYRENETAMHIFHKLDRMFPKRYLEQRWMTGAQYWVHVLVRRPRRLRRAPTRNSRNLRPIE